MGGRGINEGHQCRLGSQARLIVDPTSAREVVEHRSDVVHPQGDVIDARDSLLKVSAIGESGAVASSSSSALTGWNDVSAHALRRHLFKGFDLQSERVAIERHGGVDVLDGDPDVIENRSSFVCARQQIAGDAVRFELASRDAIEESIDSPARRDRSRSCSSRCDSRSRSR